MQPTVAPRITRCVDSHRPSGDACCCPRIHDPRHLDNGPLRGSRILAGTVPNSSWRSWTLSLPIKRKRTHSFSAPAPVRPPAATSLSVPLRCIVPLYSCRPVKLAPGRELQSSVAEPVPPPAPADQEGDGGEDGWPAGALRGRSGREQCRCAAAPPAPGPPGSEADELASATHVPTQPSPHGLVAAAGSADAPSAPPWWSCSCGATPTGRIAALAATVADVAKTVADVDRRLIAAVVDVDRRLANLERRITGWQDRQHSPHDSTQTSGSASSVLGRSVLPFEGFSTPVAHPGDLSDGDEHTLCRVVASRPPASARALRALGARLGDRRSPRRPPALLRRSTTMVLRSRPRRGRSLSPEIHFVNPERGPPRHP